MCVCVSTYMHACVSMCVCLLLSYLLHGTDEVLGGLVDVPAHGGGPALLVGGVRGIMAAHLHRVARFSRPAQLVVHDEVHGKHIQALGGETCFRKDKATLFI